MYTDQKYPLDIQADYLKLLTFVDTSGMGLQSLSNF